MPCFLLGLDLSPTRHKCSIWRQLGGLRPLGILHPCRTVRVHLLFASSGLAVNVGGSHCKSRAECLIRRPMMLGSGLSLTLASRSGRREVNNPQIARVSKGVAFSIISSKSSHQIAPDERMWQMPRDYLRQ